MRDTLDVFDLTLMLLFCDRPVPVLPQSMIEEQIIQTKKQYLGVLNAAIAQVPNTFASEYATAILCYN
jgi:hypothetical protein